VAVAVLVGGTGVLVGVAVLVAVAVGVLVAVAVFVGGTGVPVGVAVFVDVAVGVLVAVAVAVGGIAVFVDVAVGVGVLVAVAVAVGGIAVAVFVGGTGVSVAVAVLVAVAVGPVMVDITSCGGGLPSREVNLTPSALSGCNKRLYVPLPVINAVRSNSIQVPVSTAPILAITFVVGAGRLFQVIPVSVQLLSVPETVGPFDEPLTTNIRKVAFWTTVVRPETEKRM
jgi:hypothetical protein